MATATTTKTSATYATDGDDAPKWRIEHSVSNQAVCNQAACKRAGTKMAKGELRIGTHAWHETEQKFYWQWRHWACATKHQIQGLDTISDGDPTKVPGYERISEESREQLKLALEEGKILDKEFKDIRPDLVQFGGYGGEITDAVGYKVEVTKRAAAGCRGAACKEQGAKIAKGYLRLGIARIFDGEHETWQYKHWICISKYDLNAVKGFMNEGSLEGLDDLPEDFRAAILESFETGEIVEPPKLDLPATAMKSRAKKRKAADEDYEPSTGGTKETAEAKVPGRKKRNVGKVNVADEMEDSPSKNCGRKAPPSDEDIVGEQGRPVANANPREPTPSRPTEVVDPMTANMLALTERMRQDAANSKPTKRY
ncbi:hypothetical protein N0V90_004600 [Kalmusia sp. IMI 367209]|nr:hypothetical protein N0V90_004600 [Kalmusia sp. IMI 367209]